MNRVLTAASTCLFATVAIVTVAIADNPAPPTPMQADAGEIAIANRRIETAVQSAGIDSPGEVVVVYFTPRDREPAANHVERMRRIVDATDQFYTQELERHGFPGRRLNVHRDEAGLVAVIDVVGKDADKDYDKPDGQKIRREVVPVLRAKGIDPEASVILLFCNLMDYDPVASTISHHSPYYGGGTHLSGTAWQCDSEILDPLRLTDLTPLRDGQYGRITIGRHNSIFLGGVIHELGHALSLPHCRERPDEAVRGTALMGSGNQTYGQQLRNEGLGSFLTQAHALRLAAHPAFNGRVTDSLYDKPQADWSNLVIDVTEPNAVRVRGELTSDIPIHGVVAYFDPAGGSDYDAMTATAVPDDMGRFALRGEPLKAGVSAEMRLVTCHVNGATTTRKFAFRVDESGRPDLTAIRLDLELAPMLDALRAGDVSAARQSLDKLASGDQELTDIGRRVLDRFAENSEPATVDPAMISPAVRTFDLSSLRPTSAKVGWRRPTYDAVPADDRLLSIEGDYFARGIYAHAPATHEYPIGGGWRRLTGRCGIQAGNDGTVQFEILGDGKSLWKSRRISAGVGDRFDVDVSNVKTLTLQVNDGGDGNGGDWGVWIEPTLSR
ncbi:MAG: glycosyl hydrolase [Planctomycetaceae bacterium]|nr:MAG: glycosyl hydrolase [Planctomycetaceae bacterium]